MSYVLGAIYIADDVALLPDVNVPILCEVVYLLGALNNSNPRILSTLLRFEVFIVCCVGVVELLSVHLLRTLRCELHV